MSWTLSCLSMKFVSIGRHHWIPGMQVDDGHRHVLRGLRGFGCDVVENALRHWLWGDEEKEFIAITTKGLQNCLQECLLPWPNDGHQTTHAWQLHGACKSYAFPKRFVDVQHFVIPAPHLFINNGTQAFLSRFATTTLKQWNTLEQSPQSRSEGHILASCCFLHVIFGYIYILWKIFALPHDYHMLPQCVVWTRTLPFPSHLHFPCPPHWHFSRAFQFPTVSPVDIPTFRLRFFLAVPLHSFHPFPQGRSPASEAIPWMRHWMLCSNLRCRNRTSHHMQPSAVRQRHRKGTQRLIHGP